MPYIGILTGVVFCRSGGTGRRARLKIVWVTPVRVRFSPSAPSSLLVSIKAANRIQYIEEFSKGIINSFVVVCHAKFATVMAALLPRIVVVHKVIEGNKITVPPLRKLKNMDTDPN